MSERRRAGLVGAGMISEFHIKAIRALASVELVGVTDIDQARLTATGNHFKVRGFPSLEALVDAGADVIHVLTPPHVHARVAVQAMELGCDVLIEKPLAESVDECRRVMDTAKRTGRVATVNHSLLFDPQVARALAAVRADALGRVVAVDILRGSDYPPYEGGPLPPHYRTPGYPFRDLGVHCFYLIQELLGPIEDVQGQWRSLGGDPNLAFDEWRALVRCANGLGEFQLSWNVKPIQSQMIIHGTEGVLRVDLFAMFHGKRHTTPLPKAAERLVNAFTDSIQPLIDVPVGVYKFVRKEVQPFQGLRNFVAEFYRRLADGAPPPVSLEDATRIVVWVERIAAAADQDHTRHLARFTLSESVPFLVTGASGRLGGAVVKRLTEQHHRVRAMVRRIPEHPLEGVEYTFGNLGDPAAVDRAVRGAEVVIHAGAAMRGGWPEHRGATVVGTQNVIDACRKHGVRQLVHISSMSVIDWAGADGMGPVTEQTRLEPRASERGAYTRAKLEAEKLVRDAVAKDRLPAVVLRPGQIFGGGIPLVNGAVARRAAGRWLVLGDGQLELPLVYIDDVVDAITLCVERGFVGGELFQIIDPERLTQADVLNECPSRGVVRVPRSVVFALGRLSEPVLGALGKQSPISLYRLKSALARLHYESSEAERVLGWHARVGVREGVRRELK
jgi:predicted dehydrogenase/nucleoside-diphosphate-sugar epimerase